MKVAVIGIWIRGMQPGSMISGFCSDFIRYLFQVLLGCDFRSKCSAKKITESRLLRFLVYQNNALFFTFLHPYFGLSLVQAMPKGFNQNVKKNRHLQKLDLIYFYTWSHFCSAYLLFVHILAVADNCQKMTSLSLFVGSKDVGNECGSGTSWRCSGSR